MGHAKDIQLKPIAPRRGRAFIERHHYSHKCTPHTQLHIGVFLNGHLEGVMQYGPSIDPKGMLGLVRGTRLRQCIELNRLAFTERLPRNSESRALAISIRQIRRYAPHVKWIVSYADATQCGDGTIYRAAGFLLTAIKPNDALIRLPSGEIIHWIKLCKRPSRPRPELGGRSLFDVTGGRFSHKTYMAAAGGVPVSGYQLRYIRFVDETWRDRLVCDVIPYSEIERVGAQMYRGSRGGSTDSGAPSDQLGGSGANRTPPLHLVGSAG